MARTITDIQTEIDKLEELLSSGASSISIDGTTTTFRSSSEINQRIAQLKKELDERNGITPTTMYRGVSLNNGVNF